MNLNLAVDGPNRNFFLKFITLKLDVNGRLLAHGFNN